MFLGVQAGDHLIYIAEAGSDAVADFEARSNIRRPLLGTAGGKALLAYRPDAERESYLRRIRAEGPEAVDRFLEEYEQIRRTRIATNVRRRGTRFAIGTSIHNQAGEAVAAVTLVGATPLIQPHVKKLGKALLQQVDSWSQRLITPREAI